MFNVILPVTFSSGVHGLVVVWTVAGVSKLWFRVFFWTGQWFSGLVFGFVCGLAFIVGLFVCHDAYYGGTGGC